MFQPFALIPLANLMKTQKYSINDIIIQQDKPIDYFYIVSTGRLRIVRRQQTSRRLQAVNAARNISIKDNTSMPQRLTDQEAMTKDMAESSDVVESMSVQKIPKKLFDYEICNNRQQQLLEKDRVYYNKIVEYKCLSQGDYFGGRALTGMRTEMNPSGKALFTVIAEANDVQLYALEKKQLEYLPQFIQEWILAGLKRVPEFDEINESMEIAKNQEWETFKDMTYTHVKEQGEKERYIAKARLPFHL